MRLNCVNTDFHTTDAALNQLGLSADEKERIYTIVAGVLHLGNIQFEDDAGDTRGGCRLRSTDQTASRVALQRAGALLGAEPDELIECLTSRVMQATKGGVKGTVIKVPLKTYEASAARDALAKAIYSRLFDYIIGKVNTSIPFGSTSQYYIGVLDIAGFEFFTFNSFEQFNINYCNEKLQQFFNQRVLKAEQDLYTREGLNVPRIDFTDNVDCLELIERKPGGLLDLLDEESKLPKSSAQHYTTTVHQQYGGQHFRLSVPRKSRAKAHRELRDDEGFLVRHFAGAVCYSTAEFIEKNNDALHASLEAVIEESEKLRFLSTAGGGGGQQHNGGSSSNVVVVGSYDGGGRGSSAAGSSGQQVRKKLVFESVGSNFRTQLRTLMDKLDSTGAHFIRCIKPNERMVDHNFEGSLVLTQLQCSGMTTVLQLMQSGFPSRCAFATLYDMYRQALPPALVKLQPRLFCRALFRALGLNETDYKFGNSKVFFRPGKFAEFDRLMRSDPQSVARLVKKVQVWLVKAHWRRVIYGVLSVVKMHRKMVLRRQALIKLQAYARMYMVRRRYAHRMRALTELRRLNDTSMSVGKIVGQLKPGTDVFERSNAELKALQRDIESAIGQVKQNQAEKAATAPTKEQCETLCAALSAKLNTLVGTLQERVGQQRKRDEQQQQLRAMEEQMRAEREQRAAEQQRREQEEDERRQIQERWRVESEAAAKRRQEEQDRLVAERVQAQLNETDVAVGSSSSSSSATAQQQQQQERLDRELAVRLSQEVVGDDTSSTASSGGGGGNRSSSTTPQPPAASGGGILQRSNAVMQQRRAGAGCGGSSGRNNRYDLSKWKYAELRDTINTSCDLELLEACREEFHRRLKVYHAWKMRNIQTRSTTATTSSMSGNQQSTDEELLGERMPHSLLEEAKQQLALSELDSPSHRSTVATSSSNGTTTNNGGSIYPVEQQQRYFRIPLVRTTPAGNVEHGWWYAHFDGPWVSRQMESWPEKRAVLLVAGRDDMQMCELSLNETGLPAKRGAEILRGDFELAWNANGGGSSPALHAAVAAGAKKVDDKSRSSLSIQ